MKRYPVLFLLTFFFVFAVASFGQTRTASTAVIPAVAFDIADQPDAPLAVSIETKVASAMPGAPLRITNNGAATVVAYVLHIKATPRDQSHTTIFGKGIAPAASHIQGVFIPAPANGSPRPVVSIDYVQFEDGRTWGDDTLGKSKNVRAYFEGRSLSLSRLKDLLAGQDDTDFMKLIDVPHSTGFGEPVFPPGQRDPHNIDYTAKGYEEIINILRRMPKRSDEAKELARKLELMQLQ
jgi:hypothetical protein